MFCLRFFNVYGPGEYFKDKTSSMVIQLAHQILNGKPPRLFNDSHNILRDFVYIEDVIQANIKACNPKKNGVFNKLKRWMDLNSKKFGFYLTYTNDEQRKGFEYEPWHYSYKPISKNFLEEFKKNNISKLILDLDIMGKEYLTKEFIEKYINENILSVNKELEL